jgi:general secretion pathway protein M
VALALVLIPAILVMRYGIWPLVQSYATSGTELERTREDIARYQRLLNQLPALEEAVSQLERTRPLSPYLLAGSNRALAAADLQRRLQEAAERNKVTILSLRVKNPSADGPLERISVEARLRAGIDELRDLLYQIETTQPYLFVDDFSIVVRQSRRSRRGTMSGLEISLTLFGLRAPETADTLGGIRG